MLHISLSAEKIASIGPFPITNSLLSTWIVMALLTLIAYLAGRSVSLIPSNVQSMAEIVLGGLHDFFESVMGHHVKKTFPVVASLFLFIILSNWLGLLPGVGTIGFYETKKEAVVHETVNTTESAALSEVETQADSHTVPADPHATPVAGESHDEAASEAKSPEPAKEASGHGGTKFVPLLRGATADLNTTLALAVIAFLSIQYFGFATMGMHYSKRFLNFSNPIMFFVGLLEMVSDFSKIISFAFRLFGNIFAGEVLLAVMAFLMPFIAPMPFLLLELFVGFIQALVFSTLTAVFINVAVSHEE